MAKLAGWPQNAGKLGAIRERDLKAAETFKRGALVYMDANEEITECGADPAVILGMALHDAAVLPKEDKILVAECIEGLRFWMDGDNAPVAGDVGVSYGVVKDGDIWTVDGTETTTTRVQVVDVDLDRNLYLVTVLVANRQLAP